MRRILSAFASWFRGNTGPPPSKSPDSKKRRVRRLLRLWKKHWPLAAATLIAGGLLARRRETAKALVKGLSTLAASQTENLTAALAESSDHGEELHIPLVKVIRFKEQQWFMEELENSRGGDPNAMLRLAKMYLHGQGCEKSITMAAEWLRKAKYLGLNATLDEIWAGPAEELTKERMAAAAMLQSRRAAAAAAS